MAGYEVLLARSARKELEALTDPLLRRVVSKLEALASDPRPSGCRKLEGAESLWRVRVGDLRIVYSIDDAAKLVDVSAIRHRSDAYR